MSGVVEVGHAAAVGASRPRIDAGEKLRGQPVFVADTNLGNVLHGRPVLSPLAHARIRSVDVSAALAVSGVVAVLLADDLPLNGPGTRTGEPLAREEVVFAGQPVALVVAESEAAAADGAELVTLDLEPLPAVLDISAALLPDAPHARLTDSSNDADVSMHGEVVVAEGEEDQQLHPNMIGRYPYTRGDTAAAFAAADVVVGGRFETSWVHQSYLETQAAIAWPEGDGGIAVRASNQGGFYLRALLARVLGLPLHKIRVESPSTGGAFGGKLGLIEPLVAAAALAVGRPLRVVFTRSEDLAAANPAPGILFDLEVAATSEGRLLGLRGTIHVDNGAFSDASPASLLGGRAGGPYRWDTWDIDVIGVRTNRVGSGAYRAPGLPQVTFALEALVDELADRARLDPIELRARNVVEPGDERFDGVAWPRVAFREVLERVAAHPLWRRRDALPSGEGVGLAIGMFPGARQGAAATVRMDADGGLTVLTGYTDITGATTAMCAIAAETYGIDPEHVRVAAGDTGVAPHSGVSGGSSVTYSLGLAVQAAAEDARRQTLRFAAGKLGVADEELELSGGEVHVRGEPHRRLMLADIGPRVTGFSGNPPIEGHGVAAPPDLSPSAAASLVRVKVERDTGRVAVLEMVAIQDVGRAINPALCAGQMRGGAAQAIGFALFEEMRYDENGQLLNGSLFTYALPRATTVPPIETQLIELPSPHGPLGAKGIGESAVVPGAAAIASGVRAATGVQPTHLPMTPARVWRALREAGSA